MASQPERVASLESAVSLHSTFLKAIVVGAVAWLAFLTVTQIRMTGDLQAIKQKLADGPLGPIVSRLEKPQSTQQLKANLDLVASTIAVDRAQGKPPKAASLVQLSSAVRNATISNPTVEEGWRAAFQLVSYRSELNPVPRRESLASCLLDGNAAMKELSAMPDSRAAGRDIFFYKNKCALDLSDVDSYQKSEMKRFFDAVRVRFPNNGNRVSLTNAVIHYSGGQMIPIDDIWFTNCVFDFTPASVIPPASGRSLTDQLLASDLIEGSIHIANGM